MKRAGFALFMSVATACTSAAAPAPTGPSGLGDPTTSDSSTSEPVQVQPLRYRWESGARAQRVVISDTTSVTTFRGEKLENEANVVAISISTNVLAPRDGDFALEYTLDQFDIAGSDERTATWTQSLEGAKHRTRVTARGESEEIDGPSDAVFSWFIGTFETPVLPEQGVVEGTTWPGCVLWDMDTRDIDIQCTVTAMTAEAVTIAVKGTTQTWFDAPELGLDMPAAISAQHYEIDCTYEVDLSEVLPVAWQCAATGEATGTAKGDAFTMTTTVSRSMRIPDGD